jgi:hypothetical protein
MEDQLMEAVNNAVGRAAMREVLPRFDDARQSFS